MSMNRFPSALALILSASDIQLSHQHILLANGYVIIHSHGRLIGPELDEPELVQVNTP